MDGGLEVVEVTHSARKLGGTKRITVRNTGEKCNYSNLNSYQKQIPKCESLKTKWTP